MSEAQKGKKLSEEHKAKISERKTGYKYSSIALNNMAKAAKARIGKSLHTQESKAKISAKNKGSKRTDEAKAKMSAAKIGRKISEETKTKMRESHRKRLEKG